MEKIETRATGHTTAAIRTPGLHNPVRGENETYADYCKRRTISNADTHARWLHRNSHHTGRSDGAYGATHERLQRRDAVATIGIRQYKRERASAQHNLGRYGF